MLGSGSTPASSKNTLTSGFSARRRATTDPKEPGPQTMESYCDVGPSLSFRWFSRTRAAKSTADCFPRFTLISMLLGNLPDSRLRLEWRAVAVARIGVRFSGGDVALDESLSSGRQNLIGKVSHPASPPSRPFSRRRSQAANQLIILSVHIYSLQTS